MTGVPMDEVTAKDFIMVRAALVRRLGGANEALVWSRIEYRAGSAKHAHEVDGKLWWAASYEVVAEEVGLSRDQVKRAVLKLVEGGFLETTKRFGTDRTMSYSPVIAHVAESPDGGLPSGGIATIRGRNRPLNGAESPDVPLLRHLDIEDAPIVPTRAIESAFDRVWELWPSTRRGTRKKSLSTFKTAVATHGGIRSVERLIETVDAHCRAWSTWPVADHKFIPLMTTWLNQERWTGVLPETRVGKPSMVDHGRSIDEELRRRAAEREQRSVSA